MALSPQFLDELRARTSLSALIGRTTRLTKAGHEFKACCPFHNEKTPSFTVNDEKGFYHCFGCGVNGDAIRWLTDQRGMEFIDAVKELAAMASMELPAPDPRMAREIEKRDTLHDVMAAAQAWFVECLASEKGAAARAYLDKRGINGVTAREFGFGFAPDERQGIKAALARFPEPMLIEAGLRIDAEGRDPYDRFRGRLMLPIQDARGRVIAFGGRILDAAKTDAPKYLNSPDTPLFDKGNTLFNLHRAAPLARKSGRLLVVEGYMDVVALSAAGIGECVAPLGTALTERQIELLWRQVDTPILCFDGDVAGQRAAMRAVTRALPMLRPGSSLRIAPLPEDVDPDDIVRRSGAIGMEYQIAEAFTLIDYLWMREKNSMFGHSVDEKASLKARLDDYLDLITHPDMKRLYKRALLDQFFQFAFPRKDLKDPQKDVNDAEKQMDADAHPAVRSWRRVAASKLIDYNLYMRRRLGAAIARGFFYWPDQAKIYVEQLVQTHDIDRRIDAILDLAGIEGNPSGSDFLLEYAERGLELPTPSEFDALRFPFAWPGFTREVAISSLRKALQLYTVIPVVQADFERAQAEYERSFNAGQEEVVRTNENEARRLRERLAALRLDLREFEKSCEPEFAL